VTTSADALHGAGITATLVGFARTLRSAGVDAGPDRVQAMVAALAELDAASRDDTYWAGRLTLCSGPDDLPRYDRAFEAWFAGQEAGRLRPRTLVRMPRQIAVPEGGDAAADEADQPSGLATSSATEVLRHRDVARLSGAEREELRRMLALLRAPAPTRLSRRMTPAGRGALDPRRTVRAMLERGGEPARLRRRQRTRRPRRVVLLIDVSGSMAPYADSLLRFAHAAASRRRGTEVFTLGTRLTRVTRELSAASPDAALAAVSAAVADWSGGTRLGADLKEFLDLYGQRAMARGSVVMVASDGWERGDVGPLAEQMARLARLAHRVVWVNPHKARPGYQPLVAGMAAALPYVDDFVAGHSFATFEELAALLSGPGRPGA
jgi:uncharacterized protein with von Willebrand factor type A (vWA) domain